MSRDRAGGLFFSLLVVAVSASELTLLEGGCGSTLKITGATVVYLKKSTDVQTVQNCQATFEVGEKERIVVTVKTYDLVPPFGSSCATDRLDLYEFRADNTNFYFEPNGLCGKDKTGRYQTRTNKLVLSFKSTTGFSVEKNWGFQLDLLPFTDDAGTDGVARFRCDSGQWINAAYRNDGVVNCPSGSDEGSEDVKYEAPVAVIVVVVVIVLVVVLAIVLLIVFLRRRAARRSASRRQISLGSKPRQPNIERGADSEEGLTPTAPALTPDTPPPPYRAEAEPLASNSSGSNDPSV